MEIGFTTQNFLDTNSVGVQAGSCAKISPSLLTYTEASELSAAFGTTLCGQLATVAAANRVQFQSCVVPWNVSVICKSSMRTVFFHVGIARGTQMGVDASAGSVGPPEGEQKECAQGRDKSS